MPRDGAANLPTNQRITIFFSEKVKIATAEAAITLDDGGGAIAGITFEWTIAEDTVTLVMPATGDLAASTSYTLTIAAGFEDTAGNPATDPYSANFTTGSTTTPANFAVDRVLPVDSTTDVQIYSPTKFIVYFTDEVNAATVNSINFTLEETASANTVNCDIILALNLREVTLITKTNLLPTTQYTLTVASAVSDNRPTPTTLVADFTATYTTGNFTFQGKNTAVLRLFRGAATSTNFDTNAIGTTKAGDTTSTHYENK